MDESARRGASERGAEPPLHVVATAGHVDHGKSSLIVRLTGIDPDRLAEEKRRGLTIDLGFAWCALPSGHEVGFVDVPGHERFIRNMLAGVGPVRLVLLVVAADEGWKPQSEEHLAIVDVLGADGGIVALTKRDLVDDETLAVGEADVLEHLVGTVLEDAPIVPVSSATGEGIEELLRALDAMVSSARDPAADARSRLFVDRVFPIRGAGTVVTGTLTGGPLRVDDEVEICPSGRRARIRGLQTHRRSIQLARPVSRVAANLVGVDREHVVRGDVLGHPGEWRGVSVLEARVRPVRGLAHPLTPRGAYKFYAGASERDARIRFYGDPARPGGCYARIRLASPLTLDVHDRFVIREAGRRETVAGGEVLDVGPPIRRGDAEHRLAARERAAPDDLPRLVVAERGAVRASDLKLLTGSGPSIIDGAAFAEGWWVSDRLIDTTTDTVTDHLRGFHRANPLLPGDDLAVARGIVAGALRGSGVEVSPGLAEAVLALMVAGGRVVTEGSTIRLGEHRVTLAGREDEVERLIRAVAHGEPTPPTVSELRRDGFPPDVIDATARSGRLVRIAPELVVTPSFVERAVSVIREAGQEGATVSLVRERLGTSRKYAVPLLEHLDRTGATRRIGDVRVLRERG